MPTTFGTATRVAAGTVVVVVTVVATVVVVVDWTGPVLRSRTTVECSAAVVIGVPCVLTTRAMRPTGVVALATILFAGHCTTRCRWTSLGRASLQLSPTTAGSRTG